MEIVLPLLDRIPFWGLAALIVLSVGLPAAVGYRIGRKATAENDHSEQSMSTKVGAALALLAFALAFTFNMASSRFDSRRQLVVAEANAIQLTSTRAMLLPEPLPAEINILLREYVDCRLEAASHATPDVLRSAIARSEEIQRELWRHAYEFADTDASSWRASWYIDPLSDLTEMHLKRVLAGIYGRIPPAVWLSLFALTVLSMLVVGYQAGVAGNMRVFPLVILSLGFAVVIGLIADLDRPQGGLIRIKQTALLNVQHSLQQRTSEFAESQIGSEDEATREAGLQGTNP